VKALHGKEWKGGFRRRIGDYRVLFFANHKQQTVSVRSCAAALRQDLPLSVPTIIG
jgi:mRNA-degrading endonuclease RelE of RelBE toxin-antitoxin system